MSWALPYVAKLKEGETVSFRPRGHSMSGRISSGQLCIVEPARSRTLARGDIVLCKVQGTHYLHLITAVRHGQVQIGNNRGRINGWTSIDNVFGILTNIEA